MPGLLDLPPELIEQIFEKCEEVTYEEWCAGDDEGYYWPSRFGVPAFRSICRYIERATRRRFAEVYLGNGHWEIAAKAADIQKFCAQAKVEEFAANKTLLLFGLDQELGPGRRPRLDEYGRPSWLRKFAGGPGDLVPFPFLRHRDAIVEAFCACKNLTEFRFGRNWGDGDKHSVRRGAWAPRAEGEVRYSPIDFNIASSVAYVLSLADEAGIRLEKISTVDLWPGVRVGLADVGCLIQHKDVLRNLKYAGLKFFANSST
jgi:hypothetical protein